MKLPGLCSVLIAKELKRMETKRILSALCYFSVMFAGILFPLVAYFASGDLEVKHHAKKAFFSHLIPLIPLPLVLLSLYFDITRGSGEFPILMFSSAMFMVLLSLIVLVWNIVKGVKVLNLKI
jgi:dolichyl-phosphate-mannose--protein O-mannosyl transferase